MTIVNTNYGSQKSTVTCMSTPVDFVLADVRPRVIRDIFGNRVCRCGENTGKLT